MTKVGSLFAPTLINYYPLSDTNFNGHCLINNNFFIPKNIINLYISYTLDTQSRKQILH